MNGLIDNFVKRTTEAPVLSPTHPLRSALTRYGRHVARHVLTILLVSVLVAGTLIYPAPFLYTTDFTNAASNLPLHVWTDAQPLGDKHVIEPDVFMRSIWVHGSYMKAIDRDVILGALELQNEILGSTTNFDPRRQDKLASALQHNDELSRDDRDAFHIINGLTNQSWFFHSPLQYWECDAENIERDVDFLTTVNQKKTQSTSVNVTLRHSIVFSGKKFEDRQLVAADALVITLLHLRDSPVAKQWERKTKEYTARMANKWNVFPADGVPTSSQLYEFQFRPISMQDTIFLSLAYVLTATYFLLSLNKIRAVKSKLGLMVTVVAQIAMAIISSLTICSLCRVDLSRIPRAAYPLVLMAMSLENIFRLINAVIMTPSDHSTSNRIGHAFGETGHVALASVAQNLLILWGLSKVVSSGVSAFCTFAAIAIIFDFFYLSTFFLTVLSVDVRRTELSDALEKASFRFNRTGENQPRQSLVDAILQGRIALSTRIAGTTIMLGFVVMAQWHFFESESTTWSPARLLRFFWNIGRENSSTAIPYAELHQARSPKSWLRLQDHETAKEVINIVKPWAHSYIARVYDPVIFVLKGADRSPPGAARWFPDAVYDFAHHQVTPFVVTVLVIVALVRLLMNYLLWDEIAEASGEYDLEDEPLISIKSLEYGHDLDVAKLIVAPDSQVISVGLDRKIRVWHLRYNFASYVLERPKYPSDSPFPILSMAVDDESHWLALLSTQQVMLWNMPERKWGPSVAVDLHGQKPESFFFGSTRKNALRSVVIVRRNGTMVELWPDFPHSSESIVCKSPLTCVVPIAEKATSLQPDPPLSLVTLSRRACIHRVNLYSGSWVSTEVQLPLITNQEPHSILPVQIFSAYLVACHQRVDLVDLHSSKVMHTFRTEAMQSRSLNFVCSGQRTGTKGTVSSLTLAYLSEDCGDCVLQTYLPSKRFDNIYFTDASGPPGRSSCSWADTELVTRRIRNPGVWTPLMNGCVLGIRRNRESPQGSPIRGRLTGFAQTGLRRRANADSSRSRSKADENWEIWVMSRLEKEGNIETRPLVAAEDPAGLIISKLGPIVKLGYSSVAVGFGNVVKVITVGHECFGTVEEEGPKTDLMASRRRKNPRTHSQSIIGVFPTTKQHMGVSIPT